MGAKQPETPPDVIVANGAFKSGSTWLFRIAKAVVGNPPPDPWCRDDWVQPSVSEDRLSDFLDWSRARGPFVFKAHFRTHDQRDLLLGNGAIVLNIQRDLRDVLTSAYFHYRRLGQQWTSLEEFYTNKGHRTLEGIVRYHQLWSPGPNVLVLRYESLLESLEEGVRQIAHGLNVEITNEAAAAIAKANTFENYRANEDRSKKDTRERFFRQGRAGDWRHHLSPTIADEVGAMNSQLPRVSSETADTAAHVTYDAQA